MWKKILAREYGVQYTELSLRCLASENKFIVPYPLYEQIYVPEEGNEVCYIDEDKWNEFVSALKEKYLGHPENYEDFERLFIESGNDYMETAKKIADSNLKGKSNSELKEIYIDYVRKNIRYGPFIWIQFIINNFFADRTKEIISNKVGTGNKDLHDFIEIALKPDKKAAAIQLNEIASQWEKLNDSQKSELYERFQWIPCLDIHNKPWTKEEFFSHVSEFKKTSKTLMISYKELLEKIRPTKEEKKVLDVAKRLAYLKDLKDDFRREGVFYGQKLFEEISNRMGVGLADISYMLDIEILDFLDNGNRVSKTIIRDRKKGFVIYFDSGNKIVCKTGNDIESALNKLQIAASEEISHEIKGIIASRGKAKGVVKIIKGVADLSKVNKGDILVAVATHPDYVIAMHKAAAIVTDEGGITSHAAIVSRELGIPCVVGTKNATKVLKDGDLVEVNANTGLVRRVK